MPNEDLPILIGYISDVSTENLIGYLAIPQELEIVGEISLPQYSEQDIPYYEGPYEVTPHTKNEQVLNTANKQLTDDIMVFKIPYFETTNLSNGYTVYIGEV